MKDDLFDKLIQQKTGGHEAPVPADAWTNISKKKKKKRVAGWWWFTGVILLLGLAVGGYFQVKEKNNNASYIAIKTTSEGQNKNDQKVSSFTTTKKASSATSTKNSIINKQINESVSTSSSSPNNVSARITIDKTDDLIKNKKHTEKYISQKALAQKNEKDEVASIRRNKKTIAGRSKIIITNSDPITPEEDMDAPENATVSLTENHIDEVIKAKPIQNTETDPLNIDSTLASTKKIDLLQKAPEKSTENNTFITKKDPPGKKRIGLYADLSVTPYLSFYKNDPLISVKRITVTPMRKTEFTATDIRSSTEAAFAYTAALRKSINKKLAVGTGLQYSFIKENVLLSGTETSTEFNVIKRLNPNNGNPFLFDDTVSSTSTGKRTIHATNSYSLVSIPLLLHYELINKKNWAFSLVGGTYLNISTSYDNSIGGEFQPIYSNGNTGGKSENKFTADLFAGLRFSRRIGTRYVAFAEPGMRYSLMKYDMQKQINNKYIHRAGISFGLSWKLGR